MSHQEKKVYIYYFFYYIATQWKIHKLDTYFFLYVFFLIQRICNHYLSNLTKYIYNILIKCGITKRLCQICLFKH